MSAVPGSCSAARRITVPTTRAARNRRGHRRDFSSTASTMSVWDGSGWASIDGLSYTRQSMAPAGRPHRRTTRSPVDPYAVVVLIPVYNDWIAASLLLQQLDGALSAKELRARVLLVDDGS